MKRILCGLLCILMISTFVSVAGADSGNLPAINSLLQLGSTEKTEVSDVLDDYMPFNETFDEIENDIKIIVLQREAPKKEFTEKTEYPPFTGSGGFDDDFDGIDVGKSRLWLRGDLMARMPSYFIADSLEDATYLLIAETYYILDGSVSYVNYKNQEDTDLPEFPIIPNSEHFQLSAFMRQQPGGKPSWTFTIPNPCVLPKIRMHAISGEI